MIKETSKKWEPDFSDIDTANARESVRPHRSYIDNEYYERGYGSFFPDRTTVVYSILGKYAHNETQTCYPSYETIMKYMGSKNRNYISRDLKILQAYNLIQVVSGSKGRVSNGYQLMSYKVWREITSDNFDTVWKSLKKTQVVDAPVSNKTAQQYRKSTNNSVAVDTGNHINKSDKNFEVTTNFQIKGKEIIESWSYATKSMVMPYFAESDVIEFLEKNPTIKADSRLIAKGLLSEGYTPTSKFPSWHRL